MKKLILGLAVVGVVLVAAFILTRPRGTPLPTATLADGTQIIVQAVTYGTNHTFVRGSKLLGKVQQWLPGFISNLFPPPYVAKHTTSEEYLIVWYSAYNPASDKYVSPPSVDSFTVIDGDGCRFNVNQFGGSSTTPTFSLSSAFVRVFPRRQKTFKLQVAFAKSAKITLEIANPLPLNTNQWAAEPLPAERRTNDLVVRLKALNANRERTHAWTEFDVVEDGMKRMDWYSGLWNYRDATGNSSGNFLCPQERAWKVEVDLYKTAKAPFPEASIWKVPNLAFPDAGELQELTAENQVAGLSIKLLALCGAGRFKFSNDVCVSSVPWKQGDHEGFSVSSSSSGAGRKVEMEFGGSTPSLLVRVDGWRKAEELLIRARMLDGELSGCSFRGGADNLYRYVLETSQAGRKFDLQFILQKPTHFEFTVQPPRP